VVTIRGQLVKIITRGESVQPGFCGLVFDRGRVFAAAATATTKSFTANFRRQHADGILIDDTQRIDARISLFLFNNYLKRRNDV